MASRKCGRAGCRAWAVRGCNYCYAHRMDACQENVTIDTELLDRRERSDAFASAVRSGRRDALVDRAVRRVIEEVGGERSLGDEIGALRIVLQRVIAIDVLEGDPRETAATVARLVDSIVRAVRAERAMSGDLADDLSQALTTVLIEMGLGEET